MIEDEQLLRQYVENHSEPAFGDLVSRHVDLVYSVAVRLVGGDTHLAQDVVQTVFTDLSRKARSLPRSVVLAGWLYRHTFFVASTTVRAEQRRRNRERQAAQMNAPEDSTGPDWDQLGPILDEALHGLGTADRSAIVLRFFKGQDLRSVGAAMGINEDAAQKRVSRALEKLRSCLSKRGVTLAAATLAAAMTSHAVIAAPAGMASNVTASILSGTGSGSGAALTWIKFMAWLNTKTAIISAAVVLLTGVTTVYLPQRKSNRPANTKVEDNAKASSFANEAASVKHGRQGRFGFHWSQVESADYRQYIANLRAIGCPEPTLRDIIIADLNQLFRSRREAIFTPSVSVYWKKTRNAAPNPDQIKQIMTLDNEIVGILKELLGISISAHELWDEVLLRVRGSESQLLFLPADKREAVRQALIESGFEEMVEKMKLSNRFSDPERELFDEKLKILTKVLSPEELEEFRLRNSPRAERLRMEVQYLNCTPEEFKALLDLRELHLRRYGKDHMSVDRPTQIEEVRALFGDERAKEYERVSDMGYTNVRLAAARAGLPADFADRAGQIAFETRAALEKVAKNASLSAMERQHRIQALRDQADARLDAELRGQTSVGIRNALQRTLEMTAYMALQPARP